MDLSVRITPNLKLSDPFMIASSHWTATEGTFKQLAAISPSAITLKTTSQLKGGDGIEAAGRKRDMRWLYDSFGNLFARYTDGPKTVELWDIATTTRMTAAAKKILPSSCILGLSVLQEEDYKFIRKRLKVSSYGFVELNCKYSFRSYPETLIKGLEAIAADIKQFLEIFSDFPVLIKLSREIAPLIETPEFSIILATIRTAGAGLVVANSKRSIVPPSRLVNPKNILNKVQPEELDSGVLVGEYLFLETYNMIKKLSAAPKAGASDLPIVASGGVSEISGFIDLIAAGADAVQLCTFLDVKGVQAVHWLREQLTSLISEFGSFTSLIKTLRSDSQKWSSIVQRSREFEFDSKLIVERAFKKKELITGIFANTLLEECKSFPAPKPQMDLEKIPEGLRFVLLAGNASSFLLASQCIIKFRFIPLEFDSSTKFINALASPEFEYDFAIIPESILTYARKQSDKILPDNLPIKIGSISKSIFELVGLPSKKLSDIETIYQFGGTSSRNALDQLLAVHNTATLELFRPQILPLLQFWPEKAAILAKPPLSRIYGILGGPRVQEGWGPIWNTNEDLVLVAPQKGVNTSEGKKIIDSLFYRISRDRAQIAEAPESGAHQISIFGYLNYCAEYLAD